MALTTHRESNMEKWVGVLPAHNGEQILAYGSQENGTLPIYTVPANKVLLINALAVSFRVTAVGVVTGYLTVSDAVPAIRWIMGYHYSATQNPLSEAISFPIPMEALEDWTINAVSSAGGVITYASVHGILIDA